MGRSLAYRLRADLRRRLPSTVGLILLVALLGGIVLASLAGAERTSTAYDRFLDEVNPPELLVSPPGGPGVDPTPFYAEIAGLPGVRGVRAFAGMPLVAQAGTASERLLGPLSGIGVLATLEVGDGPDAEFALPRIVAGRLPDATRADEVLLSERFADASGLQVGDRIDAVLLTSEQTNTMQVATPDDGRPVQLVVTGIGVPFDEVIPFSELSSFGSMVATPPLAAMVRREDWNFEGAQVDVDPSYDLDTLVAAVEELGLRPDLGTGGPVFTSDQQAAARQVSDALQPLAVGLLVAGGAIGLVALVVIGQAVARSTRGVQAEAGAHRAIGLRPADRVAFAVARAACIGAVGALGAMALATLLSGRFPIGVARPAEPHPGLRADASVLLLGGLAIAVATTLSAVPAAITGLRTQPRTLRPARAAGAAAASHLSPAAAQGLRFALLGSGGRSIPLRSTLAAVTLATTAVLATVTFGDSLVALVETPERYGQGWDRMVDAQFGPAPVTRVIDRLEGVEGVRGIAAGNYGDVTVNGLSVPGFDFESIAGAVSVGIAEGRSASAAGEIVLGGETIDRLGVGVGDTVEVDTGAGPRPMRLVGRGVFPGMGQGSFSTTGLGVGAQLPPQSFESFGDVGEVPPAYERDGNRYNFVAIDIEGSTAAVDAAMEELEAATVADGAFAFLRHDQPPTKVQDLARVRVVPAATAGALALVAVAALAHLLVTSVRERRRELALLRALGFSKRQLRASVAWHASAIALVAVAIGLPLGVALGRAVWEWFADSLAVAAPAETPWVWIAVAAPAVVVLANLVAAIPGRSAGRTSAALVLRDD